jgi:hypothetical protein
MDAIYLIPTPWDDYYHRLTFDASNVDNDAKVNALGEVKVAHIGIKEGTIKLEGGVSRLGEQCFSLGQSQSYYQTIRALPDETEPVSGLSSRL